METKTPKNRLTLFIQAIVEQLMPKDSVGEVGDMLEVYSSNRELLMALGHTIYAVVRARTSVAFDIRLLAGEACVLYISFAMAPVLPLIMVLAVALGILVLRDGYIHPADGSPHETATDAIVTTVVIVISQLFFRVVAPPLALPNAMLLRGTAISMAMVCAWRMIFRMKTSPKKPQTPALELYKDTWRMNLVWSVACAALIVSNGDVVPHTSPLFRFLLGFLPPVVYFLTYHRQLNALSGRTRTLPRLSSPDDSYKKERETKRDRILQDAPSTLYLEILFFGLLALPLGVAIREWLSGGEAAANVDWLQAAVNSGALLMLSVFWIYIKKMNRNAVRALQDEIDKADGVVLNR